MQISSVIVLYVDDLLIAANAADMKKFGRAMAQFKTGARESVELNAPVEYLGIEIARDADGNYGIHQKNYINELHLIRHEDVRQQNSMVISKDRWGTLNRQAIGRLIWSCQTRFDSSAVVTFLSTSAVESMTDLNLAKEFMRSYNRIVTTMQKEPLTIWYHPICSPIPSTIAEVLKSILLVTFSDAVSETLTQCRSTQAVVLILAKATPLKNLAPAQGCLLWGGAAKFTRVVRSSSGAEVAALSNALDVAAWYQSYLFGILTGQFHHDLQNPSDALPLINPFLFGRNRTSLAEVRLPMGDIQAKQLMQTQCVFCAFSIPLGETALAENYDTWFVGPVALRVK